MKALLAAREQAGKIRGGSSSGSVHYDSDHATGITTESLTKAVLALNKKIYVKNGLHLSATCYDWFFRPDDMEDFITQSISAPDLLAFYTERQLAKKSDIYALGLVMIKFYAIYTLSGSLDNAVHAKQFTRIIRDMVQPNPLKRATIENILGRVNAIAASAAFKYGPEERGVSVRVEEVEPVISSSLGQLKRDEVPQEI